MESSSYPELAKKLSSWMKNSGQREIKLNDGDIFNEVALSTMEEFNKPDFHLYQIYACIGSILGPENINIILSFTNKDYEHTKKLKDIINVQIYIYQKLKKGCIYYTHYKDHRKEVFNP